MEKLIKLVYLYLMVLGVDSASHFPSVFSQSHWIDNIKGDIEFTTWQMKGWELNVSNQIIGTWELVDGSKFATDGYLALRTDDTFTYSGKTYHAYTCLKFEKLGEDLYRYNSLADPLPLLAGARVKVHTSDALTKFDDVCDLDYDVDKAEYNILVKKGTIPKRTCPNVILGDFTYELENPNGSTPCSENTTEWDGCSDNNVISFNYKTCSHKVAYSAEGQLSCLDSRKSSKPDYTDIMVYNLDESVDNIDTFRFSCIRVVKGRTEDLKEMLIMPGFCREDRWLIDFPEENGARIGQKLTATEYGSCHYFPPGDDAGLSKGAIAGIVIGVIVFILICIAAIYCCRQKK